MAELACWPCWLTDSGLLNHKVVTHPASSLAQDRESFVGDLLYFPDIGLGEVSHH